MSCDLLIKHIREYNPSCDGIRIVKAFDLAKAAHKGQKRSSGEEYISHPLATAQILADLHVDEDTIIAALLHDVVEDTDISLNEIKDQFGSEVSVLVDAVTKLTNFKHKHQNKHISTLRKLFLTMSQDVRAVLIKLADRLHNMRTIDYRIPEKIYAKSQETVDIYIPLALLLGVKCFSSELEDLCFTHLHPQEASYLFDKVSEEKHKIRKLAKNVRNSLEKVGVEHNINIEVSFRLRHIASIFKKLCDQEKTYDQFNNKLIFEVIAESEKDCYLAVGAIHSLWKPVPHSFKDFIATPKYNQYKSLQTQVFTNDGNIVEFHIYTKEMYYVALYGVAAPFFVCNDKPQFSLKKIPWVKNLLSVERLEKNDKAFLNQLKIDIFQDRIAVYTPFGDVVDLPQGATIIDFAYRVHSDMGCYLYKAKVNNMEAPIYKQLKSGDIVEIIKSEEKAPPDRRWLYFVKTAYAKLNVKRSLRKFSNGEKLIEGEKILNNELARFGMTRLSKEKLALMLNRYKLATLDDLYKALSDAKIDISDLFTSSYTVMELLPFDVVTVSESESLDGCFLVELSLSAKNRIGLMRDVSYQISKLNIFSTYSMNNSHVSNGNILMRVSLYINNINDLYRIIFSLEMISGVNKVFF